tara:strand:- start:1962 stop:2603 length:642 start_codon:yes stop_codon:yes gene_type:complete
LSPNNHKIINKLLRNNNISTTTRIKINKLLYLGYEKWAIKNAYKFKKRHIYKCLRIPNQELINYAQCGLYKSILNYNGFSNFTNYASIYINSELKKALTDSYSLSILPKSIRISSKKNLTELEKDYYKKLLNVETYSNPNYLYDNKQETPIDLYNKHEKNYEIWNKINELEPFIKRCIYLKYDYNFKKIRTNKRVAELMCCSEEYIRKRLNSI